MKNTFTYRNGMDEQAGQFPVYEFETTEELLALPPVIRAKSFPKFCGFALSGNHLMEISNYGFHWWVLGRIRDVSKIDLPQWDGGKYVAELPGQHRPTVLYGNEIRSSVGDELTLQDGSKARWLR